MVCRVFVSGRGNAFMREIAEHLVEALAIGGRPAELCTDDLPALGADPLDNLVVAPHEFFGLFAASDADRAAAAARSVCINTEQPGTPFFESAMHHAARGPVVLDINSLSLDAVRRRGLDVVHLPLGYVPSLDRWHGVDDAPRPVDIAFMGGRTERREAFLGGAARMLWEWHTELRVFSWHRPIGDQAAGFLLGEAKYQRLAETRVLLNVHRGDDPYFEWARVLEAMANGCVVASESSVGTAPLLAGEHLLEAPLEHLAEQAVALAFDEPRRRRMAAAAYELLTSELQQTALVDAALRDAAALVGRRPNRQRPGSPSFRVPSRVPAGARAVRAATRRAVDAGRSLLAHDAQRAAERSALGRQATDLKRTYLAQLRANRGVERALALARHGDADHLDIVDTPAWHTAPPTDVSVVVPLFDQGGYLCEAVASVVAAAAADRPAIELIVVDDHSTDDSATVAAGLLAAHPWFPMRLVGRAANGGLPVARNTGFAQARGRYVFALDADNVLYPNGLRVLVEHLERSGPEVAAAYGILERFDDTGALGLTSHLPWDVDLLVQGAYIDAMALLRRSAWHELGGYRDEPGLYGWEDYDLWLSMAERGWRADLVPRIVGRYREQPGSMRRISDIDMPANFVTLRERHPRLPWPS
jgi:hypothetical protein